MHTVTVAVRSSAVNESIRDFALFTDVSLNPGLKCGVGAYIMVPASLLDASSGIIGRPGIKVRRFEGTSSTRLELQTALWALEEIRQKPQGGLTLYSDSQCVSGLLVRKTRLLAGGFLSKKTGRQLSDASLYRRFYELHDRLRFQVVKVAGHPGSRIHDPAHRIFSLVDRGARKALKIWLKELAKVQAEAAGSAWCVYVLRCSNNSLYIGMTNNLQKRIERHQLGTGSKFVRSWRPFELIRTIPCSNEGEARRLEYDLKKLTKKKKMAALGLNDSSKGGLNHATKIDIGKGYCYYSEGCIASGKNQIFSGGNMLGKKTVKKTVKKAVKKAIKKVTKVEKKVAKKVVKKVTAVKKTVAKKTSSAVKAVKKKISK